MAKLDRMGQAERWYTPEWRICAACQVAQFPLIKHSGQVLCDECFPDVHNPRVRFRADDEGYETDEHGRKGLPRCYEREVLFDGEYIGKLRYRPGGWYPLYGLAGFAGDETYWPDYDLHRAARDIEVAVRHGVYPDGSAIHPESMAGNYDPTWQRGWVE